MDLLLRKNRPQSRRTDPNQRLPTHLLEHQLPRRQTRTSLTSSPSASKPPLPPQLPPPPTTLVNSLPLIIRPARRHHRPEPDAVHRGPDGSDGERHGDLHGAGHAAHVRRDRVPLGGQLDAGAADGLRRTVPRARQSEADEGVFRV